MRRLLPWSFFGLVVAASSGAHAGGADTGLLPVAGDPATAGLLSSGLPRQLSERYHVLVVAPAVLQARLRSEGAEAARAAVMSAEQRLLEMDRRRASEEARRAIRLLDEVGGRYHAPQLTGRAHLALARALLLKPADVDGARAALRSALEASPRTVELEASSLPPRVAELLQQARREPARNHPPAVGELASLCRQARLKSLVWIAARDRGAEVELELLAGGAGTTLRHVQRRVPRERLLEEAAQLVTSLVGRPAAPSPSPAPTPWYRRWWVWAIAGAVVAAGVTAGVVVGTTRQGSDDFTFRFRFE